MIKQMSFFPLLLEKECGPLLFDMSPFGNEILHSDHSIKSQILFTRENYLETHLFWKIASSSSIFGWQNNKMCITAVILNSADTPWFPLRQIKHSSSVVLRQSCHSVAYSIGSGYVETLACPPTAYGSNSCALSGLNTGEIISVTRCSVCFPWLHDLLDAHKFSMLTKTSCNSFFDWLIILCLSKSPGCRHICVYSYIMVVSVSLSLFFNTLGVFVFPPAWFVSALALGETHRGRAEECWQRHFLHQQPAEVRQEEAERWRYVAS